MYGRRRAESNGVLTVISHALPQLLPGISQVVPGHPDDIAEQREGSTMKFRKDPVLGRANLIPGLALQSQEAGIPVPEVRSMNKEGAKLVPGLNL